RRGAALRRHDRGARRRLRLRQDGRVPAPRADRRHQDRQRRRPSVLRGLCGRQEVLAQVDRDAGGPFAIPRAGRPAGPQPSPLATELRMTEFLVQWIGEVWSILREASLFLLVGFTVAGVLAVLVPSRLFARLLGRGKIRSVLWASAIGAPIPLCSCGVLPTALGLSRQGATKGATVSFLISTPETGIDSIALTYALMDPIITVFRPIAGVLTAVVAGIVTNVWGTRGASGAADSSHGSVPGAEASEATPLHLPAPPAPHRRLRRFPPSLGSAFR